MQHLRQAWELDMVWDRDASQIASCGKHAVLIDQFVNAFSRTANKQRCIRTDSAFPSDHAHQQQVRGRQ